MFSQNIILEPKHFEIFLLNNEFIHFTEFCSSEKETLGQRLTIILVVIGLFYRLGTISDLIDRPLSLIPFQSKEGGRLYCTTVLYIVQCPLYWWGSYPNIDLRKLWIRLLDD